MTCLGGVGSRCNAGVAENCEYKIYNPSIVAVDVEQINGYSDGFDIIWNPATYPTYFVRTLYRVKGSSGFPFPDSIVLKSSGGMVSPVLGSDLEIDVYIRLENDTEHGGWGRYETITNSVLTPDSKIVLNDTKTVLFDEKIIVKG